MWIKIRIRQTVKSVISGGIRIRILQKLNAVAFQFWNLNVVAFCPLKKCLGIAMLCLICLRFSIPWRFQRQIWFYSPNLDVTFFWGHGIAISWLFGLGIPILWFMCLHGFIFRGCPRNNLKVSINQNRRNRWCQIVRRTI